VLERIRPELVPQGWQNEVSVKSDALQIALRQRVRALEERGWLLDEAGHKAGDEAGKGRREVKVIACPARREVASWALSPLFAMESFTWANEKENVIHDGGAFCLATGPKDMAKSACRFTHQSRFSWDSHAYQEHRRQSAFESSHERRGH
jgi:hypothetical protein